MNILKTIQQDQKLWDLFTRKVEYSSHIRDQCDRFPFSANGNQNILEPSVSRYLTEQGYHFEYPEGKPFAICLTHDIDTLYKRKLGKVYAAILHLKKGHVSECLNSLYQMRSKKLPWWNFSEIMKLEEKYGAKSSFFFMVQDPEDPHYPFDNHYTYNIEDCGDVIGEISDREWEVGLHGSHTAYTDPEEMKQKKVRLEQILNKNIVGYRNHFLRFRIPDSWEYLERAGFLYDTTLGYAESIGFRNGMCHPFKPYNLTKQKEIDIIEIPLNIMDTTLYKYMKLDASTVWERTKQAIDTVEQYHGVLTLLWHNESFIGEQKKMYEKILKYSSEKGAWLTSGKDIAEWFDHSS